MPVVVNNVKKCSLCIIDKQTDKAFNSIEMQKALKTLRPKMIFDTRDNYVPAEQIRKKYKQIFNSKEYVDAKKELVKTIPK